MTERSTLNDDPDTPVQNILVYRSDSFRVENGANLGDGMSVAEDLVPDDIYHLSQNAEPQRLALKDGAFGAFEVAVGSHCGQVGATLHLDCALLLMSPDGQNTEALIFVEVDERQNISDVYMLALGQLLPKTDYALVRIDTKTAHQKFAEAACVSFTRGTHITLASGAQVPIEDLRIGDKVLTRDDGAQEIRWIGQNTVRATGDFAPIVIKAGTLNNANDLVVSREHRLFVYQRSDQIGAGQSELLVKARHLVNDDTVFEQTGGFVDYFQLLFDRHHIIYAEGIAAESLRIDPRTKQVLPPEILGRMSNLLPSHARRRMHALDVQRALLDRPDAIELLRRASLR